MFKSMQKKQNHMELMEEIKSIEKLLMKTNSLIADEFNFEEHLIEYMDTLFYSDVGVHPDQIYLIGKMDCGREIRLSLYRS
ncbi:hypothetical protein ABVW54_000302 [Listeria monocytogenes]|nr:hypothetical protein [Listeria monocytogenes]EAG7495024.1 hypothetical protein [Listeria monocytogenes]EAG7722332.1 hypothetical protein [Listeria monocytogenes]EAH1253499.1 hypothetical protein [Listeria monocytogenes]EAH1324294.1 hypothetical protein [Listeria monocytogenes]